MSRPAYLALLLIVFFWCDSPHGLRSQQRFQDFSLQKQQAILERMLTESILPFWSETIDRESGGFLLNHDPSGRVISNNGPKGIVTQARTVWFYSALIRAGFDTREAYESAHHGFEFLKNSLWDEEFGGFYWQVTGDGDSAIRPNKHLYGQAFGLYALSEYFLATRNREALKMANSLFRLIEYEAHDPDYGGYRELFERDWSKPAGNSDGYMGVSPDHKTMNTHLHLMEALTRYYDASRDALARERLLELIRIQTNAVVRKDLGACTDKFDRRWLRLRSPEFDRVSYGHDIENVWLIMDASETAGIEQGPFRDLYRTLFEYSLRYGYDESQGGFYDSGPPGEPADQLNKVWWVQAEALVSSLKMLQSFDDSRYLKVFTETLGWIAQHQTDWDGGDWLAVVNARDQVEGGRAGLWKSPYHNGRAVLECLKLLSEINGKEP